MLASVKQNVRSTVWSGAVRTDSGVAQLTGATGLSQAATASTAVSGSPRKTDFFVNRDIVAGRFLLRGSEVTSDGGRTDRVLIAAHPRDWEFPG